MSVGQSERVSNVWVALGAYALFVLLTAGFCVGLAFVAAAVGANVRLLGLLSVPLGLVTARLLFSARFRRPIVGPGVSAGVLGIVVAKWGGDLGGLILLGFVVGYFLYIDWLGAIRLLKRFRPPAQ